MIRIKSPIIALSFGPVGCTGPECTDNQAVGWKIIEQNESYAIVEYDESHKDIAAVEFGSRAEIVTTSEKL